MISCASLAQQVPSPLGLGRGFGHVVNISDDAKIRIRRTSPRNDRLQGQIVGLERRTSAVGRDTISHPDRGHDDVANAVAGAAALSKFGGYDTSLRWVSGDDDDSDAAGSASVFKPSSTAGGASVYDGVLRGLPC